MYNSRQLMFQIGALRVLLKCIHFAIFEPAKFSAVNKWIINKYINNDLEVAHPQSGSLSSSFLVKLEFGSVGFWGEGKREYPAKNLSEQRREPTTNSTHIWPRRQDLNPGHIGEKRALSPLRHPLLPSFCGVTWLQFGFTDLFFSI